MGRGGVRQLIGYLVTGVNDPLELRALLDVGWGELLTLLESPAVVKYVEGWWKVMDADTRMHADLLYAAGKATGVDPPQIGELQRQVGVKRGEEGDGSDT